MIRFRTQLRARRPRRYQPELGTLEDRALQTQLGVVAPRAAGVVHVANNHGPSTRPLPLTTLVGEWNARTWLSAVAGRVLGTSTTEVNSHNTIVAHRGAIVASDNTGGQIAEWSIHRRPNGQLALSSISGAGVDPTTFPGRPFGQSSWLFQGTGVLPTGPTPFRASILLANRNTYVFSQQALIDGQWELLYSTIAQRTTPRP